VAASTVTEYETASSTPTYTPPITGDGQLPLPAPVPTLPEDSFGYWQDPALLPERNFTTFFDTLASEDWTAALNNGSAPDGGESSALLGGMQATW
jgi:hypothetical protein